MTGFLVGFGVVSVVYAAYTTLIKVIKVTKHGESDEYFTLDIFAMAIGMTMILLALHD